MAQKPETKFTKKVTTDLRTIVGAWFFKTQEVGRKGIPDIIGCIDGNFFALEIKVGDNTATELQEFVLSKIAIAGGSVAVVTPSNWGDILLLLRKLSSAQVATRDLH